VKNQGLWKDILELKYWNWRNLNKSNTWGWA